MHPFLAHYLGGPAFSATSTPDTLLLGFGLGAAQHRWRTFRPGRVNVA
jgi:hypothetical protein